MSIKDFFAEQRAERKRLKQEKKASKKRPLTKEEKKYKVFSILLTLFLIVGSIIVSCSGLSGGDFTWEKISGITPEMITELQKPVNEQDLLFDDKLTTADWDECNNKLMAVGINMDFKSAEKLEPTENFYLTHRDLGALVTKYLENMGELSNQKLINLKIYSSADGNTWYIKTLVYVNMSSMYSSSSLPWIYLTTTAEVEVINKEIINFSSTAKINQIDDDKNTEIMRVLNAGFNDYNKYGVTSLITFINVFSLQMETDMNLGYQKIQFIKKTI